MGSYDETLLCGEEDYAKQWDPAAYSKTYYEEESPLVKWAIVHLKAVFDKINVGEGRLFNAGTGPIPAYLLPAARHFTSIYVSDFNQANLLALKNFASGRGDQQKVALDLSCGYLGDGEPNSLDLIKTLQKSIKDVVYCDVTLPTPLKDYKLAPVDVLMSSLCIETATKDKNEYAKAVERLARLYLKKGGTVVLLIATEQTFWKVGNGTYHCCPMTRQDIAIMLDRLGFTNVTMKELGFDPSVRLEDTSNAAGFVIATGTKSF